MGFQRQVIGFGMLCLRFQKIFLGSEPCALSRSIFPELSDRFYIFSCATNTPVDRPLLVFLFDEIQSFFVFVIVPGGLSCYGYC